VKKRKKIELLLLLLVPLFYGFVETPIKAQSIFEDVTVDVPYINMPQKDIEKILEMAQVGPNDLLYDLGSGDGRIVIAAVEKRGARGVGVEINGELVRESRRKAERAGIAERATFIENDLFKVDFREATVVTLYLMPDLNLDLRPTLLSLRPGTRVISHSWDMGEWQPDEAVLTPSLTVRMFPDRKVRRSRIYLWVIPANVSGIWEWPKVSGENTRLLRISQRFQKAEGFFTTVAGEETADIEIHGERVRITTAEGNQPMVFEGKAAGDVIEGTVTFGLEAEAERAPWKAVRRTGTMAPLDS